MSTAPVRQSLLRTRWSAIGAAVAVTLGAGGLGIAQAAVEADPKPVTVTVDAARILDTREDLGLEGAFEAATPRDLQVTGEVDIAPTGTDTVVPDGAIAVLVNVTVVAPSEPGFVALRSGGTTGEPETSTVNFTAAGVVEPNAATVKLSDDGKIQIYLASQTTAGTADVLIDVVGYTVDHDHDDRYYTEDEVDTAVSDAVAASSGVASASDDAGVDLDLDVETELLALPISVPQDGSLVVNGVANLVLGDGISVGCWITLDDPASSGAFAVFFDSGDFTSSVSVWSDTRGFDVAAGDHTLYLGCERDNGDGSSIATVQIRRLTTTFSPNSL